MSEETQDFDLNAAAEEIIAESEPQEAATSETEAVSSDNQETEPQKTEAESTELSAEEILNKLGEEKADPKASTELLNSINALGAIYNGAPVKIESTDQLKELIQKGYDYTKKTMSHSEEVKAWKENQAKVEAEWKTKETQLQQQESQLAETIFENQIAEAVLTQMRDSDPDLFEEFKTRYNTEVSKRNQVLPYMKQFESQFQQLNGEIQSLKQDKTQKELSGIKQNWEQELQNTQTKYAPLTTKLGVKVDWEKVKKTWTNDASNSMTVEQALNAVYGSEMSKAYQSHQKLLATKNKTNTAMLKRTGASSNPGGKSESNNYGDNYEAFLRANA